MNKGWICPICGRGLAPWVSECPCYMNRPITSNKAIISTNHVQSWGNLKGGRCDKVCDNKTDLGYCRTTACIKSEYGGDPNYGIGNGV